MSNSSRANNTSSDSALNIQQFRLKGWHLFLASIATLSLVDGVLRIRVGAAWELSALFSLFLIFHVVAQQPLSTQNKKQFLVLLLALLIVILANVTGYLVYARDLVLNASIEEQIVSTEARMVVETIRFIASIGMFFLVSVYLNTSRRGLIIMRTFLYGAIVQSVYVLYEIIVRYLGLSNTLPLLSRVFNLPILRAYGTFYEPSQLGQFFVVSIFLFILYLTLLSRVDQSKDYLYRKRYWIISLFSIVVMGSLSRTAIFVFFLTASVGVFIKFPLVIRLLFLRPINLVALSLLSFFLVRVAFTIFGSDYFSNWWYLIAVADESTTNSSAQRFNSVTEYLQFVGESYSINPLGIGQGMSMIAANGMVPFIFRLPSELGILGTLFFVGLIFFAVRGCFLLKKDWWAGALLLMSLLLISVNYNTTNHPWMWFILALVPALGAVFP